MKRGEPVKKLNLSQMLFLLNNQKDSRINTYIEENDFIFVFIDHLSELFSKSNQTFKILEPLLDPELDNEQQTVLSLDSVEVGELHLISNSFFDDASLVYYSPSGLLELYIIEFDNYPSLLLSEYILLLNEFASVLIGEKQLYEKIKSRGL